MPMHPYLALPAHHFWRRQITIHAEIEYDVARKFLFDLSQDCFATGGSCFAQHFGRELRRMGGRLCAAETRHPLMAEDAQHGYDLFSARYGNIYTTRQLRELVEQAFGLRPPIFEWARKADGRWVDMLRPTAVDEGFSSIEEARADRIFHLSRVRALFHECTVFVFTLGLTECWENTRDGFVYPLCPGTTAGEFDDRIHRFRNLTYPECLDDLRRVFDIVLHANPKLRVILTVSPVMLVASFEKRGALESSVASKSILRAVADACRNESDSVDYFPAFEIIAGPQARGRFYDETGRDVSADGVAAVMGAFFASRLGMNLEAPQTADASQTRDSLTSVSADITRALQAECDELLLDPSHKLRQ
jgi:GSCFA family protein